MSIATEGMKQAKDVLGVSAGRVIIGRVALVTQGPTSICASAMMTVWGRHSSDLVEHHATPTDIYTRHTRQLT